MADITNPNDPNITVGSSIDLAKLMQGVSGGEGVPDVSPLIKAIGGADNNASTQMTIAAQAGIQKQISALATQAQQAVAVKTAQEQEALRQKAIYDQGAQTQEQNQQMLIQQTANGIETPQELVAKAQQLKAMDAQLDAQHADITARRNIGFLDNPAAWIYNQFALPADTAAFNSAVVDRNSAAHEYDDYVAMGTQAADYIKKTNANYTAEMLIAKNKQIAAEAMAGMAAAQAVKSQFSIPVLTAQAAAIGATHSEVMNNIQLNLQKQQLASSLKTADLQQQMTQTVLNDRKSEDQIIQKVNEKTGLNLDHNTFTMMTPERRAALIGIGTAAQGHNFYDPFQQFNNIVTADVPIQNPQARAVLSLQQTDVNNWTQELASPANMAKYPTPQAKAAALHEKFNAKWGNADTVGGNLPIPSYGELAADSLVNAGGQSLASNPIWKDYGLAMVKNHATTQTPVNPQQLIGIANDLVSSKKLAPEAAAAQLQNIFQTLNLHQQKAMDSTMLGLPVPTSLPMNLPGFIKGITSGNSTTVNGLDVVQITNYLKRQQAAGVWGGLSDPLAATNNFLEATVGGDKAKLKARFADGTQ